MIRDRKTSMANFTCKVFKCIYRGKKRSRLNISRFKTKAINLPKSVLYQKRVAVVNLLAYIPFGLN
jgi:hypothetical protein